MQSELFMLNFKFISVCTINNGFLITVLSACTASPLIIIMKLPFTPVVCLFYVSDLLGTTCKEVSPQQPTNLRDSTQKFPHSYFNIARLHHTAKNKNQHLPLHVRLLFLPKNKQKTNKNATEFAITPYFVHPSVSCKHNRQILISWSNTSRKA